MYQNGSSSLGGCYQGNRNQIGGKTWPDLVRNGENRTINKCINFVMVHGRDINIVAADFQFHPQSLEHFGDDAKHINPTAF